MFSYSDWLADLSLLIKFQAHQLNIQTPNFFNYTKPVIVFCQKIYCCVSLNKLRLSTPWWIIFPPTLFFQAVVFPHVGTLLWLLAKMFVQFFSDNCTLMRLFILSTRFAPAKQKDSAGKNAGACVLGWKSAAASQARLAHQPRGLISLPSCARGGRLGGVSTGLEAGTPAAILLIYVRRPSLYVCVRCNNYHLPITRRLPSPFA